MAESLASDLILKLGLVIAKEVQQEVRMVSGVKQAVETLQSTLQSIQALLADAEKRQFKEQEVRLWLIKLKDAAYDIEDVLEDWNIVLQSRSIIENGHNSKYSSTLCCILGPCLSVKQVKLRHDIVKKIRDVNENLEKIASDRIRFSLSLTSEELERFKTTSFDVDESSICGRDLEMDTLVEKLCGISSKESEIEVISIVGMGGVGKTTVAQMVFNHNKVISSFQKRIWVCVSDPFDQIAIIRSIIESITGSTPNHMALQTLLEQVAKVITEEKFLLVLDDVWNQDDRKWEPLKNALNYGAEGSVILITTRNVAVSDIMGATFKVFFNVLSDEECWFIFSHQALRGKCMDSKRNMIEIGREIVKKCKGLPLSARILGGLLRFKDTTEEWQAILDNELWQVDETRSGLFPFLLLSYHDLPSPLRRCFTLCAIFPKDYEIDKEMLISLWASQGLLTSRQDMEKETTGEYYFNMLCVRSLFMDVRKQVEIESMRITFKMHDIVHDFVQYLGEKEVFQIKMHHLSQIHHKSTTSSLTKARHLGLSLGEENEKLHDVIKYSSIDIRDARTFLLMGFSFFQFEGQLKYFKQLRALIVANFPLLRIANEIGKVSNLRYLDLSECQSLVELPETLCNLFNLQILNLRNCSALVKLPEKLGKLTNLRHLILDGTHNLKALPSGITRLTSLRKLTKFIISNDRNTHRSNIGDLKKFVNLKGFIHIMSLGLVTSKEEAETAELKNKDKILHLLMNFDQPTYFGCETKESYRHFNFIQGLTPPPSLEYLKIYGYRGLIFPDWMVALTNLKTLILRYCWKCEKLPPLGLLPLLESLQLREFPSLKEVGVEFLGKTQDEMPLIAFPKLKELVMIGMTNWLEWIGPAEITSKKEGQPSLELLSMPCLSSLQLGLCPKLKSLPCFLHATPISHLVVEYCNKSVEISAQSMSHVKDIVIENEDDSGHESSCLS